MIELICFKLKNTLLNQIVKLNLVKLSKKIRLKGYSGINYYNNSKVSYFDT
jgi:hypothetical protein